MMAHVKKKTRNIEQHNEFCAFCINFVFLFHKFWLFVCSMNCASHISQTFWLIRWLCSQFSYHIEWTRNCFSWNEKKKQLENKGQTDGIQEKLPHERKRINCFLSIKWWWWCDQLIHFIVDLRAFIWSINATALYILWSSVRCRAN